MTTVIDPKSGHAALVKLCKVCDRPIYFGLTGNGKRCPYDIVDDEPTRISHFISCPQVDRFRQLNPKN